MFSKMIGTGSYGYVYHPCLFFLDVSSENMQIMQETIKNRNNHVSKLLKKEFAEKELFRYELIRIADPYNNFHLGNMFMANPSRRNIPLLSIGANGKEIVDHFNEYQLIIMKYGGKTLREYGQRAYTPSTTKYIDDLRSSADFGNIIYNNKKTHVNHKYEQNIVIFWKDSIRLIQGVNCFIQNNIVHHDIKSANIVFDYDEDVDINKCKNRSNYIDFGLSQSMESIYEKSKMSQYNYSIFYYNFPPELFLYDKERFEIFRNLNIKERTRWFNYICTSWINPPNKNNQCSKTDAVNIVEAAGQRAECLQQLTQKVTSSPEEFGQTPLTEGFDCLLSNNSDDSDDNDFDHSFMDSTNQVISELKNTKILEQYLNCQNTKEKLIENFQKFLLYDIDKYPNFKSFIKNSLYTLDIYGLGQTLLYMLIYTYQFLPKSFVEKMHILLHKMTHNNVTERITIKNLLHEYTILLQLLDIGTQD